LFVQPEHCLSDVVVQSLLRYCPLVQSPSEQAVQDACPGLEVKVSPSVQNPHVDCPSDPWNLPAAHWVHVDCPSESWNFPVAHEEQADWPSEPANWPLGHAEQADWPSEADICPLAHWERVDWPSEPWNSPLAHAVQVDSETAPVAADFFPVAHFVQEEPANPVATSW